MDANTPTPPSPAPRPPPSVQAAEEKPTEPSAAVSPALPPPFPEIAAPKPRVHSPSPPPSARIDVNVEAPVPTSLATTSKPLLFNPPTASSAPRAASSTPHLRPRTPKVSPPRPSTGDGAMLAGAANAAGAQQRSPEMNRPLNVTDALSYLDAVKVQFQDKPDVYNHFLDIMKDFKSQVIDTPGVIERVSMLFHGNPYLIQGFNTFLPPGYRIDISADPRDNMITVTTPSGTTTQSSNAFGQIPRTARESGVASLPPIGAALPFGGGPQPTLPPLSSSGSLSRPLTPNAFHLNQLRGPFDNLSTGYISPGLQVPSTTAAASFLGGLNNRNPVEKQPAGEFNHAIQYLNKIKARYSDDPNTYKQFLEILQTYQKEQRHLQDSQVYVQVQMLFKDAPDLLGEFKDFLPDAAGAISAPNGVVGILPHPTGGTDAHVSSWGKPEMIPSGSGDRADKSTKKAAPPSKRRKRPPEKDTTPVPPAKSAPTRSKKAKHHHKPEPQSPTFSPYQVPMSPQHGHAQGHGHGHSQMQPQPSSLSHSHTAQAGGSSSHAAGHSNMPDELLFFDRAKKALESRETYEEFLKLLNLYSKDIIDTKILIDRAQLFLGDSDLLVQFKALMGWDDRLGSIDHGPPGSIRTGPPEALSALPADDGEGPSYRKVPESEIRLACSGRDQLCRSVLNDEWVSHPTWASEESGFVAHKKNTYEESLHKSEEERHEYHVHIEALTRTIAILEPLNIRINEMSQEERTVFKLNADLGGSSKSIYHRIIKRVYGREAGLEVIQALQDCPAVAVPVVLARLKQRDEEWRRAQREWSRTWREVDAKNFYKSLDHQGISFKANDKKNITAKHFVADIESIKAERARVQATEDIPSFARGSLGFQLEFDLQDTSVLHDCLKMVYSFLDHSHAQYSTAERRSVEKFLRSFVPLLCMYPAAEFNAACGPLEGANDDDAGMDVPSDGLRSGRRSEGGNSQVGGVAASDLRKKLLKTAQEKSVPSASGSRSGSPAPGSPKARPDEEPSGPFASRDTSEDVWIREAIISLPGEHAVANPSAPRMPFFANTTFYTLLRLLQLLYTRLSAFKEIGAALAAKQHSHLLANPIAVELGLDEPNGPSIVLAQAIEALGDHAANQTPNVVYMYLLDACEKVFDNELDQSTFEEHMRWFFGNKAFYAFTLDKVITALVKQVQTILADNRCQELWSLLQAIRDAEKLSNWEKIRYRREAERHVGSDEHLYRIEWEHQPKILRIQLVGAEDPSIDEGASAVGRWREYVDTYLMRHATEWMPTPAGTKGPFLTRCLPAEDTPTPGPSTQNDLAIRISLGTYKIFYEAGTEDCMWREWDREQHSKAMKKQEERKRSKWLQ